MKALGAPIDQFKFSKPWTILLSFGCVMFGFFAVAAFTFERQELDAWMPFAFVGFFTLNLYALIVGRRLSLTVCEAGLRYTTFRHQGEMAWEDVEKFRYGIVNMRIKGVIPVTQYTMIVVDKNGQSADFSVNFERPKKRAALLLNKLHSVLLQKTMTAFECGSELDLGAVKISRAAILLSRPLQKPITVPTANVAGCFVDNGNIVIAERTQGGIQNHSVPVRSVDNAFAFMELIKTRIAPRTKAAGAAR